MMTKFTERFKMGRAEGEDHFYEYLAPPSWDCGWYWGFGYLQSKDIHHHIDTLDRTSNIWDALKAYYGDTLTITDDADLWTFCELVATFYALKKSAEVLGRGGAHYGTNPVADVVKNEAEARRINEVVMPAIFDALETLISKYR